MVNLMDLEAIKNIAVKAAYNGGKSLVKHFGNLKNYSKKGEIDLVTIADIESEKAILDTIQERFPDHGILAEESGRINGDGGLWIIDPLDGTTNFANNIGLFSISIAFASEGELMAGVVMNPVSGELFTAEKGKGARLNGHPICVSTSKKVSNSLLVTGFPYNLRTTLKTLMIRFENCLKASMGVRRMGSAALDLCYVASGRFSGFWEQNLKPWDTAAGTLVAREAGAMVTDFSGVFFSPDKKEILATNGLIHDEMISLLTI